VGAAAPRGRRNTPARLSATRAAALTTLAMIAFAGNSLLCRAALRDTSIDAATFTAIRMVSGAAMLAAIVALRRPRTAFGGSWASAMALFAYAAFFSFAYLSLTAATGALLLFGAVQATMIGWGLYRGERLALRQWAGIALAVGGLVLLLAPGIEAPSPLGATAMIAAGAAWGIYSLRGRGVADPLAVTAGNFARTVVFSIVLVAATVNTARLDVTGALLAIASGAVASGVGYAIWYTALKGLKATSAATVQLSVPIIAALGGVALLAEPLSPRLLIASVATLGGIALVVSAKR
jgi:drug/metabolite transporter (DMT)-like permease